MEKIIYIIEDLVDPEHIRSEDGGQAAMIPLVKEGEKDNDNGMFVMLQSWDDKKEHSDFRTFVGRKVRITIETID